MKAFVLSLSASLSLTLTLGALSPAFADEVPGSDGWSGILTCGEYRPTGDSSGSDASKFSMYIGKAQNDEGTARDLMLFKSRGDGSVLAGQSEKGCELRDSLLTCTLGSMTTQIDLAQNAEVHHIRSVAGREVVYMIVNAKITVPYGTALNLVRRSFMGKCHTAFAMPSVGSYATKSSD